MNELTYFIAKRTPALLSTTFDTDCQQRAAEVKNTCTWLCLPPNYNQSALLLAICWHWLPAKSSRGKSTQ